MEESTTTDEWSFNFENPKPVKAAENSGTEAPFYLQGKSWDNYADPDLYELDCLVRAWMQDKIDRKVWTENTIAKKRRVMSKQVWYDIYGEEHPKGSSGKLNKLTRILDWYAYRTHDKNCTTVNGKPNKSKVYVMSVKRFKQAPAYSLKLRLELMEKEGKLPTWQNMKLPKYTANQRVAMTGRKLNEYFD